MDIKNQGDGRVRAFPSHEEGIFVFASDFYGIQLTSIVDLGYVTLEAAQQAVQPDPECAGAYTIVGMSGLVDVTIPDSDNIAGTHITSFREFSPEV